MLLHDWQFSSDDWFGQRESQARTVLIVAGKAGISIWPLGSLAHLFVGKGPDTHSLIGTLS